MHAAGERKCPHCEGFFLPDARNRDRQRYCAKVRCRRASKAASQRRWVSQPANADYFHDAGNAARARAWQAAHPGYWKKRPPRSLVVLQEHCPAQTAPAAQVKVPDAGVVLQDDWLRQPPLLIGLIAHLAGVTLQEDIAAMTGRLLAVGHAVLGASPGLALPRC
jgi:hypothetical protein